MAGMQYSFFPTDFYYPRPHTLPVEPRPTAGAVIPPDEERKSEAQDDNNSTADQSQKANNLVQQGSKQRIYYPSLMGLCCVLSQYNRSQTSAAAVALYCALSAYNQELEVVD